MTSANLTSELMAEENYREELKTLRAKCAELENSLKLCDMERGRYQVKCAAMEKVVDAAEKVYREDGIFSLNASLLGNALRAYREGGK
jgi:hypothetical protein